MAVEVDPLAFLVEFTGGQRNRKIVTVEYSSPEDSLGFEICKDVRFRDTNIYFVNFPKDHFQSVIQFPSHFFESEFPKAL